jgi:hypothetical protein
MPKRPAQGLSQSSAGSTAAGTILASQRSKVPLATLRMYCAWRTCHRLSRWNTGAGLKLPLHDHASSSELKGAATGWQPHQQGGSYHTCQAQMCVVCNLPVEHGQLPAKRHLATNCSQPGQLLTWSNTWPPRSNLSWTGNNICSSITRLFQAQFRASRLSEQSTCPRPRQI